MKKLLTTAITMALMALGTALAATTGSYIGAAKSLSPSSSEQTLKVTLVPSYDPEDKTTDSDWGVYYVKVSVSKGKTFSIWADNKSDEFMMLSEDYDPDDEKLMASCDSYSRSDGELYVLTSDCWDEDDPSKGTFYFYVDGDVGTTCTLHYTSEAIDGETWEGDEPPPPLGSSENPEKLNITEEWTVHKGTYIEGDYYYYFTAEANRAYRIRGVSGTEKNSLALSEGVDSEAETEWLNDRSFTGGAENEAYEIRALTAGKVVVVVSGNENSSFQIQAIKLKSRTIGQHESEELNSGNEFKASFTPGRLSSKEDTWDNIIDERLFKIALDAGERCIFQTAGADTNLMMRVYDGKGSTLEENFGSLGYDTYIGFVAPAAGTYYVGVCQDEVEFCDTPTAAEVTLTVTKVGAPVDGDPDEWDAKDDVLGGATVVEAEVSNGAGNPVTGEGHGDHQLSLTDWVDCFSVKVQRGISYKFVADSAAETDFSLLGEVYFTETGKTASELKKSGVVSGGHYVSFTPIKNGECRIRVSVREGKGRDFPAYRFHVVAYVPGQNLGYLTVNIKGAPSATWTYKNSLYSDTTKRAPGEKVLTWGSNTITFSAVKGYTIADKITYVMTGDEEKDVVTGVYNDTSDPGDDKPSGTYAEGKKKYASVKITPSAKGASVERSLHDEDPADWFQFTATAGNYYRFALSGKDGDAIVRVYGPGNWTNEVKNVLNDDTNNVWHVLAEQKGTYYVCVTHGDPEAKETDGSYRLTATSANVGAVKFAKTAVSVKETAVYADLTVNRTAKDGMIRMKFATEDGTAVDHEDYYATNGVICWANGDNKAKTIRVRLLPELYQIWRPNRAFKVRLSTFAEDEIDKTQEYIPVLQTPESVVTITETGKKAPGTVGVSACTNDAVQAEAEITVKSPSVTVSDDCGSLTFALARTVGANGRVAVKVETVKGTANAGKEFEPVNETLYWDEGDVENKFVTVKISPLGDPSVVTKNFKLKLSAVKKDAGGSYESVKIGTSTLTVNLRNNLVEETAEELAKTINKAEGLVLKAAKAGTWYVDSKDGALKTIPLAGKQNAELTFTLTGPGLFRVTPKNVEGLGKYECKIGKEASFTVSSGEEIVRLVPAGSTAVKFSAACEPTSSQMFVAALDAAYDEEPYFWMPLAGVAADLPENKATVLPAVERQTFRWSVPAKAAGSGIYYRFTLSEKAKDLGTGAAKILTTGLTESEYTYVGALDANKTYCWRVDYSLDSENWIVPKTSWTFKTAAGTEGIPMPAVVEGATDSYGRDIVVGEPIGLMQGVKVNFALTASNTEAVVAYSLANGKLPDGVKLVTDKKSGVTSITGVPTKAGEFNVLVQAKAGKTVGTTEAFSFNVKSLALCAGTFNGVLKHVSESADVAGMGALSSVAFTASEKGALSAKVQIAGKSYTFKATGYDRVEKDEDSGDEMLSVALEQIQKIGKVAYTNVLDFTVQYDELDSEGKAMLGGSAEATLTMDALSTDKAYAGERVWNGGIYRDNTELAAMVADEVAFVGYYTMALCPQKGADPKAAPAGNGYLTLTVDNKGKVKVAGKLADGTALSGSVPAVLSWADTDVCDPGQVALLVPYYFVKSTSLFGGTIILKKLADGSIVVDPGRTMIWNNDAVNATYGGTAGFAMEIVPTGGYYDTLVNLQRYYLDNRFLFDVSDDLPKELFAQGYALSEFGLPNDEKNIEMLINGDTPTVAKRSMVGSKTLYSLGESVNPWDVKLTFKRATGILTGSLSVWAETADGKAQKEIKGLKHEGVLLLNRCDMVGPLAENVWTAGYYLVPTTLPKAGGANGTRKWTCSLPFNILMAESEKFED